MRITAGLYRGKKICTSIKGNSKTTFRPTTSRTREAIINVIKNYHLNNSIDINEAHALDLFAGSGVMGLEFMSMGCKSILFIDKSPLHTKIIKQNIMDFGIDEQSSTLCIDTQKLPPAMKKFNIIFMDPPYYDNKLITNTLNKLVEQSYIDNNNLIIIESCFRQNLEIPQELSSLEKRKYGKSLFTFLNYKGSSK